MPSHNFALTCSICSVLLLGPVHAQDPSADALPRIAPLEPSEAQESFLLKDGFEPALLALCAADPAKVQQVLVEKIRPQFVPAQQALKQLVGFQLDGARRQFEEATQRYRMIQKTAITTVVTGLLFAGRAGTSLTAEIGLMKAGEQLAAMEMMAIDPKSRVLAPRFVAGIVSMPILAVLFSAIGIIGAWVVAVLLIGIDPGNFWSIQQNKVDVWRDVGNGIVKSMVFGVICTFVALYQGHETEATPEGVAYATTRTVVISSLAILGMDFILTALMFSTP